MMMNVDHGYTTIINGVINMLWYLTAYYSICAITMLILLISLIILLVVVIISDFREFVKILREPS